MGRRRVFWAQAAEATLDALMVTAPLLLGGAPAWALWPTCALAMAALLFASLSSATQHQRLRIPLAAAIPGVVVALCALQLVPLPPPLLHVISPRAWELRQFALEPLGLTGWRPVTLDVPATWRELAKHGAYTAVLIAAAEVARSRRARSRLLVAVCLCGGLLAAIGVFHKLANLHAVFGWYAFKAAAPPVVTPFGNPNHLAAFLTLTASVTLGFTARTSKRRLVWVVLFAAEAVVVFLSLSRGGAVFFVAAMGLFGAALLLKERPRRALYAAAASLGALAFGGAVALDQLWAEFSTGASKTDLWPMYARGASEFWFAGMGRGSFEAAFPRFQTQLGGYALTNPENVVLQLCSELGVLAAAALVALCALVLSRAASRRDLWSPELGALCGLVALGAHELFDFSLELPPTAVMAALLLGLVVRSPDAAADEAQTRDAKVPGPQAVAMAGAALATVLGALFLGRSTLSTAEADLRTALATAPRAEIAPAVARAVNAHPAYSMLPALAAQAYARVGAPLEALAFVNRALYLRPLDAASHRIAARALLELGRRSQAFLEYRLAIVAGDGPALREAIPRTRSVDELDRLCPDDRWVVDDAITQTWMAGRPEHAIGLARALAERLAGKPDAAMVWARLVEFYVSRADLAAANEALQTLTEYEPLSARHAMAQARVLVASGDAKGAAGVLFDQTAREPGDLEVAMMLVDQLLGMNQPRAARDALVRVAPFVTGPGDRARFLAAQGRAFEKEERFAKALEAYETASRLQPMAPGYHYSVARMHERHAQPGAAARAVQEGMRVDSPAGAASVREWADKLLAEERKQLFEHAPLDPQSRERLLHDKMLEADLESQGAPK